MRRENMGGATDPEDKTLELSSNAKLIKTLVHEPSFNLNSFQETLFTAFQQHDLQRSLLTRISIENALQFSVISLFLKKCIEQGLDLNDSLMTYSIVQNQQVDNQTKKSAHLAIVFKCFEQGKFVNPLIFYQANWFNTSSLYQEFETLVLNSDKTPEAVFDFLKEDKRKKKFTLSDVKPTPDVCEDDSAEVEFSVAEISLDDARSEQSFLPVSENEEELEHERHVPFEQALEAMEESAAFIKNRVF